MKPNSMFAGLKPMRKVLANRSLPLSTSVVMAAQAFPDTVMIGDEAVPVDELVVLEGTRNQRRLQRKRLMKGKGK